MPVERAPASSGKSFRRNLVEAEILERAAQVFSERGYGATSLQDIAADLGLSRSSLYHYFPNKEHLLTRLVSDLVTSSEVALRHMKEADASDPASALREAVGALLGPILEAPNRFRLLLTVEAELPAPIAERWRETRRSIVAEVSGLIRDGIEAGQFRPVDEQVATFTVLGMCNWVAWWPSRQRQDVETLQHEIADIAVAGLAATADVQAPRTPRAAIKAARDQLDRLEVLVSSTARTGA